MIHYTKGEEIVNTLSHGAGILLGIAVGIVFIVWSIDGGDNLARTGVILYLVGMLFSYVTSTVYHAMPRRLSAAREVWRRCDHAAIYWHIAGSYSPITLIAMRDEGMWGWGLFAFVWLCAIGGTVASFVKLKEHNHFETLCYCLMGLSVLVAFKPLMDCVSPQALGWIVAEGVCYIAGALFYSFYRRPYMHSVFHFFVLAGSVCHIVAVWDILVDYL